MQRTYDTKAEYAFKYLKEKILSGALAQGDDIVISHIAEQTGMSTIPIREALKRLESEGLVVIQPHKGAQVTSFDVKRFTEVITVRAVLEAFAASLAARQMTPKLILRLRQMNDKMTKAAVEGDFSKFSMINKEFHREIYEAGGNRLLVDTIINLWDGGNWSSNIFKYYPEKMKDSAEDHKVILDALERGDVEGVKTLVEQHKLRNLEVYEMTAMMVFNH